MMNRTASMQLLRAGLVVLIGIGSAGCAGPGLFRSAESASPFRDPGMSMRTASDAVVVGQSTKVEVASVLGAANVVRFDSGFEVWVYRTNASSDAAINATNPAELVILFAPSGVVKKTRLNPSM